MILASKSPRRQQILREAGFKFSVLERETEEVWPESLPVRDVPEYLARLKAELFKEEAQEALVLTADTVVLLDDSILGKPSDAQDAFRMLRALSGRVHTVITGVCLFSHEGMNSFSDESLVHFGPLTDGEIRNYIEEFRPFDKAGAYGIQDRIGMTGITKIEGSFWNVMGLPVHRVYSEVRRLGLTTV